MKRVISSLACFITISICGMVFSGMALAGNIIYVNAGAAGGNNGTSWVNAYTDLQSALSQAAATDEIWVAAGTYLPSPTGDRSATFRLKFDVALYGGFAGTETRRDERNFKTNVTILSGDLNRDDASGGNKGENSYHVVTGRRTNEPSLLGGILDGFSIIGGNAADYGGGMLCDISSPILANCIFSGNSASRSGGGMSSTGAGIGSPALTNCVFSGNSASQVGGGMSAINSSPALTNCTFSGNFAGIGDGMYISQGSPIVTNCIFWGDAGQQIYDGGGSSQNIIYSDIRGGYIGIGNIDSEPLFIDADGPDGIVGTADDDLRLSIGSPCIDTGNPDPKYNDKDGTRSDMGIFGSFSSAPEGKLLLWNKLGSDYEVANSEIGPNGEIIGSINYESGRFGNGFRSALRTGDRDIPANYIKFENLVLGRKGCIELWYHPDWNSGAVGHVINLVEYGKLPNGPVLGVSFNDWQNRFGLGVYSYGYGQSVAKYIVPSMTPGWSTTAPFHMAYVWDDSISEPAQRAKIFLNGVDVSILNGVWPASPKFDNWGTDFVLYLGSRMTSGDWSRHHWEPNIDAVIDNIKIWDYAKADFSDRFIEDANTNVAPVAQDSSVTLDENTFSTITLQATDANRGTALTYEIVGISGRGSLSVLDQNTLTYTPDRHYYGSDTFTFKASDGKLYSNTATVSITVNRVNNQPIAVAGSDITVEAIGQLTPIMLTGANSYDIDEDDAIETFRWYEDNAIIAQAMNSIVSLGLGNHKITLIVNDGEADSSIIDLGLDNDSVVHAIVTDTTPPTITVSLSPNTIWPANNKMVSITATVTAGDIGDPAPKAVLTSIICNEPFGADDIQSAAYGTPDYAFLLKATRLGSGNGRVYTVTYMATDASGNSASGTATVTIPHDQGKNAFKIGAQLS